jgi:diguanylate cyclase (GGDEF)-like protein/PAS domain S-box-containing protein
MDVAVLFVEDAPDDAELLLRELRRGGLEVEWRRVETEPALRDALAERRWDVALLDYVLPHFSALHALPVIRELDPDLPAIVVSGTIGEDVAVGAMRAGAADYILKDDLRRLVPAIEREVRDCAAKRERRVAVSERDLSEARYRTLYDQSPAGVLLYDDALRITECNERLAAISGVPRGTLRGMDLGTIRSAQLVKALRGALTGDTGSFEGPYQLAVTGVSLYVALTAAPLRDGGGAVVGGFAVVQDLTERQEFLGTIRKLAYEDGVTGLPNAALFRDRLRQALTLAKRERRGLAVAIVDLDRFKQVNDTLGRPGGDRLLRSVGRRLRKVLDDGDTVARVAADEFAVLLPAVAEPDTVAAVAESVLGTLRRRYRIAAHDLYVNASVGLALYPSDADDAEALMRFATEAMQAQKRHGGNSWRLYDESMSQRAVERLRLESRLHLALERHEFVVHYQPLVGVDGRLAGLEALVRWQDPDDGLVLPGEFIPIAEETGLIVPLGEEVLATACRQMAAWVAQGLEPGRMAVNLSARQFRQKDLVEVVQRALHDSGLPPRLLELEITESTAMDDVAFTRDVLGRLRGLGVSSSLDDFGTGYSSLSQLSTLPFDVLKIDRAFVSGIGGRSSEAAIVRAVIALGHELGLTVVAEGVETHEELAFVREHGCDQVQGFLLSRPVTADEATAVVARGIFAL